MSDQEYEEFAYGDWYMDNCPCPISASGINKETVGFDDRMDKQKVAEEFDRRASDSVHSGTKALISYDKAKSIWNDMISYYNKKYEMASNTDSMKERYRRRMEIAEGVREDLFQDEEE